MKRERKLLILLAALVVLCVAVWGVGKLSQGSPVPNGTNVTQTVYAVEADTVKKLEWTYGETTISLEKTETGWSYTPDAKMPVDPSYPEKILEGLGEVLSYKTIEAPEDTGVFGINQPVCTITVTADTVTTLTVGNETALGGQNYLTIGDGNVYVVDSSFLYEYDCKLLDLVQKEAIPDFSNLTRISYTAEEESFDLEYREGENLSYSDHYVWFEGETPLDTEAVEEMIANLENLRWVSCATYAATEAELESWGLTEPAAVYEIAYEGSDTQQAGVFRVEIGDGTADAEAAYARLTGSDIVYLVDIDVANALCGMSLNGLKINDILRLDEKLVTSVEITLDGATYKIDRTEKEAEEGKTTSVWTLSDKETDFGGVLKTLNSMEGTNTGTPFAADKGRELTFLFHLDSEEYPQVELVFYQYDGTNTLVSLNGSSDILLGRTQLVELKEAVNALVLS